MSSSRPSAFLFSQQGPYRLYSTAELLRMPAPTWLVDRVIPDGGFITLFAPRESFKSFATLDLALSIATGRPWQGRAVQQGFVIYIAAEGVTGLGKRISAWCRHHGVDPDEPDIAWLTESLPVAADSEALLALLGRIEEVQRCPKAIFIDTLARCFDGEENETADMGRFVAGVDVLRHKFKCAVFVIHHTRLDGTRERGNTALGGASDAMLQLTRESGSPEVVISCAKMKDDEHFEDIGLRLTSVEGTGSCVLTGMVAAQVVEQRMIELLAEAGPLSWNDWRDLCIGNGCEGFQSVSARRSVRARIVKVGGLWRVK